MERVYFHRNGYISSVNTFLGDNSLFSLKNPLKKKTRLLKEMRYIEMSKAAPKKSICHFQKLDMMLK